jgi:hypothetical protein
MRERNIPNPSKRGEVQVRHNYEVLKSLIDEDPTLLEGKYLQRLCDRYTQKTNLIITYSSIANIFRRNHEVHGGRWPTKEAKAKGRAHDTAPLYAWCREHPEFRDAPATAVWRAYTAHAVRNGLATPSETYWLGFLKREGIWDAETE